jgi:enoyl-CoA hydratase
VSSDLRDARPVSSHERGYEVLDLEQDGHVATLYLDRPEKRNAMGPAFWRELPLAMQGLSRDESVRVVVIAARGPHFSVGLDLSALGDLAGETTPAGGGSTPSAAAIARRTRAEIERLQSAISSVAECPKPVVAAVHGYCIGGGVDLVAACDIRVAALDAVFSVRETRMAIVADLGSLQRLPQIIPMGHVAELAYTGKDISAERAARIGLVNEVFPDQAAALAGAHETARQIAANSPLAVQGTKAVLKRLHRQQVADGLDYVAAWNAGHLRSDDLAEAVVSFMEKRAPKFEGR